MANKSFGSIFYNNRKKNPAEPDVRGTFNLTPDMIEDIRRAPVNSYGQVELTVAMWKKQGPKAGEYLNGNMEVNTKPDQTRSNTQRKPERNEPEEEIPF